MKPSLHLGVGQTIITPEIGGHLYGYNNDTYSDSVHDDLTATVFYLQEENKKALLVSVTVCIIHTSLTDRIRKLLAEETGVPAENCIISATHTHSGPCTTGSAGWGDIDTAYCEGIFIPQILEAAKEAMKAPAPVKMGVAVGKSYVGINRRQLYTDNVIRLGQNPWGPFCPDMTVISFRDAEDKTVANMIHYGAHCTASGRNSEITRDWAGVMIDRLAERTGGVTAFFNGFEGDVGPRLTNGDTCGNIHYAMELGGVAAQDAVRIYNEIRTYADASLTCLETNVRLPLQKRLTPEEAKAEIAYHSQITNRTVSILRTNQCERILASYEAGEKDAEYKDIPQNLIKIGDVAFVGFPYEAFSEIGMRIRQASKIPHVLPLSNANGDECYFVTEDAIPRGGYEVAMFLYKHIQPFTPNADWHLVTETLKNLEELSCIE